MRRFLLFASAMQQQQPMCIMNDKDKPLVILVLVIDQTRRRCRGHGCILGILISLLDFGRLPGSRRRRSMKRFRSTRLQWCWSWPWRGPRTVLRSLGGRIIHNLRGQDVFFVIHVIFVPLFLVLLTIEVFLELLRAIESLEETQFGCSVVTESTATRSVH